MEKTYTILFITLFFISFRATGRDVFPACTNDDICSAVNLGALSPNDTLGDKTKALYDNFCATNTNELNPLNYGFWRNDAGVWFTFTTGSQVNSIHRIEMLPNPEGTGQYIDLQVAVFEPVAAACNGFKRLKAAKGSVGGTELTLDLICLKSNTTYYVLVDGDDKGYRGNFGIQVASLSVKEGADDKCAAEDLGLVPDGGATDTQGRRSNFCSSSFRDPAVPIFATQVTVWFKFQAPASGHVWVGSFGDSTFYPLSTQLAVFASTNGRCDGNLFHIGSTYTEADYDERLELRCLTPFDTYWVMIDGYGTQGTGVFALEIADAGIIPPAVTHLDTVICHGDSLPVGFSIYHTTGDYIDTLHSPQFCDSIIYTKLTVLPPLSLTIDQTWPAIGLGAPNGKASATATGGAGGYQLNWSNGETGTTAVALPGGATICVDVVDNKGCNTSGCLLVDQVEPLSVLVQTDQNLDCHGDRTGKIEIQVAGGRPTYTIQWLQGDTGNETIRTDYFNEVKPAAIQNLPAGIYRAHISDQFFDTTFTWTITQPEKLEIINPVVQNAACFSQCNGALEWQIRGGVLPYSTIFNGKNTLANAQVDLCAGLYPIAVSDANGCKTGQTFEIAEPAPFVVQAIVDQHVSCYEGMDGSISVKTSGNPSVFQWNNGASAGQLNSLPAGSYAVTVTNEDGCMADATAIINQPQAPLRVDITLEEGVSCFGQKDGALKALANGPGKTITYQWDNGQGGAIVKNIGAGSYTVVVQNENGCEATAMYALNEPPLLTAEVQVQHITCRTGPRDGKISFLNVQGGTGGYHYALNQGVLQGLSTFNKLDAGEYTAVVEDAAGCKLEIPATVNPIPQIEVSLGPDKLIELGDSVLLQAPANYEGLRYEWTLSDGQTLEGSEKTMLRPFESNLVKVLVTDESTGCTASDAIFLTVDKLTRLYVPTAFSPNGDGHNDAFMFYGGKGVLQIISLSVFNRQGSLVYQIKNALPEDELSGWDGKFNGKDLLPGIYVFAAELELLNGTKEWVKGDVLLVR